MTHRIVELARPALLVVLLLAQIPALAPQTPPLELVVADAKKEIEALEGLVERLKPGDKTTGGQLKKRLDLAGRKLESAKDKSRPEWDELVKRHAALGKKIVDTANAAPAPPKVDPAALTALDSDVRKASSELRAATVEAFADAATVAQWKERIAALKARHAALDASDRQVANLGAAIESLQATLEARVAEKSARANATEAESRLQGILDTYKAAALPPRLSEPFEADHARDWGKTMRTLLTERLPKDLAVIEEIAKLPDTPKQRVESVRHWVGVEAKRDLEERVAEASRRVAGLVDRASRFAAFVLAIDPTSAHDVSNKLLGEGRFDTNMAKLQEGLVAVAAAKALDEGLARPPAPDVAEAGKALERAVEHLRKSAITALADVRMPPAKSTDPKLIAAATEVLKDPKHKIPGWKRLVINYDVERKERWESTLSPGTVTTTITTQHIVWDEFQVTTAEKVGEDYFLFANRLKLFHSAGSTTPTGKWILAERFQSTRILPASIDL